MPGTNISWSLGLVAYLCLSDAVVAQVRTDWPSRPPIGRFDPTVAPPVPDYVGPTNWASLPSIRDDSDMTPQGVAEAPQLRAEADVFFVHGAVPLREAVWNADTRDVWFNGDVGQTTIRNQASVFNGCCAIYAPRYRQANPAAKSDAARELAYSDIARAFAEFRRRVGDRPFILAGHGQGSRLGQMLIEREIAGRPVAAHMVAAYLPGHAIPLDWFATRRDVRQCTGATDIGCVATWAMRVERSRSAPGPAIACNNPISWTTGPALAPRGAHLGAWMRGGMDRPEPSQAPDAGLIDARCGADGRLHVSPPGDRYSGDLDALDIQLVWMDVRQNAIARVAAFLAARR